MKINWGTGLAIGMLLFIGFIMTLVITMSTDDKYAHELVTEEYYKKELELQDNIHALQNRNRDGMHITMTTEASGLLLHFPQGLNASEIEGKVSLYRPSSEQLDFDLPIVVSNSQMLIPGHRLPEGRWDMEVRWSYKGTDYLHRKKITY